MRTKTVRFCTPTTAAVKRERSAILHAARQNESRGENVCTAELPFRRHETT